MNTILKTTWSILAKRERKHFVFLLLLDIIISVADILSLALLLWIVQFYIQPGQTIPTFLPSWFSTNRSIAFIAFFFFLFILKNLAGFSIARTWYRFTSRVAIRISRHNLSQYQHAPFSEFTDTDSSVHIRKISFQPFEFCQYILSGVQQIITQAFLVLATVTGILLFNAKLFLLLFILLLPPVFVLFYFIRNRLARVRVHIRTSNERSFQYLLDALKGYVESNVYSRHPFFMERFIRHRLQFSNSLFASISIQNMPPRLIEIFAVSGLFILIVIARDNGNSSADLLTVGAFMAAAYKIIPGMVRIINTIGQIKTYAFSANELIPSPRAEQKDKEIYPPEPIHSVQLKKLAFRYATQPVLDHFCLAARQGDFIGICGKSGKGKTTLFNLVLGFLEPEAGEILINGVRACPLQLKKYQAAISYVRQQPFLIHDTLLRNITLEEEVPDNERLKHALAISGLDKLVADSPEGLQRIITENGKNISGGQQQRIALARALYKPADLILLDEPFNELDEASENLLLEYFRSLAANGKIVLLITHSVRSLAYCNKIICLDEA